MFTAGTPIGRCPYNNNIIMKHIYIVLTLAYPKLKLMALAWPMCRMPLGSGGNLVTTYSKQVYYMCTMHIQILYV